MIEKADGEQSVGLFVQGLTQADLDRLAYYEGGFDYDLRSLAVTLEDGTQAQAQVFFPEPAAWVPDGPWSLDAWVERLGNVTALAAEEEMGYFGRVAPSDMARSMPAI